MANHVLLARTLLFNKDYKGAASVLENTTILPYEGATDGRQMYREAWLMQAVDQIQSKRYKNALASIEKAKLWPERLGAGKPYDEDLDLRLEHYLEAVALERSKDRAKAEEKYEAIANAKRSGRNQINNLITALALKKLGRADEGEQLLKEWTEKNTDNKISRWAYAQYAGSEASSDIDTSGNDNLRIVKEVMERGL